MSFQQHIQAVNTMSSSNLILYFYLLYLQDMAVSRVAIKTCFPQIIAYSDRAFHDWAGWTQKLLLSHTFSCCDLSGEWSAAEIELPTQLNKGQLKEQQKPTMSNYSVQLGAEVSLRALPPFFWNAGRTKALYDWFWSHRMNLQSLNWYPTFLKVRNEKLLLFLNNCMIKINDELIHWECHIQQNNLKITALSKNFSCNALHLTTQTHDVVWLTLTDMNLLISPQFEQPHQTTDKAASHKNKHRHAWV